MGDAGIELFLDQTQGSHAEDHWQGAVPAQSGLSMHEALAKHTGAPFQVRYNALNAINAPLNAMMAEVP